jgi:Cdc6-like AAA superfamily ATPase
MARSPVSAGAELLERTGQLSALEASLAAVVEDGRGRIVFVGGEAGVVKTTLLRRFCADQQASETQRQYVQRLQTMGFEGWLIPKKHGR